VLALFVVFQQEIRKFLLFVGTQYLSRRKLSIQRLFTKQRDSAYRGVNVEAIVTASRNMSASKTGALMVIRRSASLANMEATGDAINADTSNRLLENIFFKNTPLHDGAVIIDGAYIRAARCVLPSTENQSLPAHYGMRHRAALGVSENSDAVVVVVSEETGYMSFVEAGKIVSHLTDTELTEVLEKALK
jgi:uncharacterized protein (TIGR00159 family)